MSFALRFSQASFARYISTSSASAAPLAATFARAASDAASSSPPTLANASSEKGALGILSGTPEEHLTRRLKIYRPAKTAMQSGKSKSKIWKAEFEKLSQNGDRWINPLMGWTSTGDPVSNLSLQFMTKEDAIEYAQRNGLNYKVIEPEEAKGNFRKIAPYGKSMVHHWRHTGTPKYAGDK